MITDFTNEVTNLVESPTPFCGHFEERFLALPSAVLVAVMKKHQRYFPVYATADRLLPCFIAVRNGDALHLDTVIAGNEHVLRARFADAEFFYKSDVQHQLADFLPRLATLTFHADLGSMLDKVQRVTQLTHRLAQALQLLPLLVAGFGQLGNAGFKIGAGLGVTLLDPVQPLGQLRHGAAFGLQRLVQGCRVVRRHQCRGHAVQTLADPVQRCGDATLQFGYRRHVLHGSSCSGAG